MAEQGGRDEETCLPSLNLTEAFKQQSYTSARAKPRSTVAAYLPLSSVAQTPGAAQTEGNDLHELTSDSKDSATKSLARRLSCKRRMKQSLPGCRWTLLDAISWPTRIGQVVNVSTPNLSSPSAPLQPLIHWIFTYFRRVVAILQWLINKVWPSSKSKIFENMSHISSA